MSINTYDTFEGFQRAFDSRLNPGGGDRYLITDTGTVMSATVYNTGGTVRIVNMMSGVFLVEPPHDCANIADVINWVKSTNPCVKEEHIESLDGTTLSFLYNIARGYDDCTKWVDSNSFVMDVEKTRLGLA